MAYDALPSQASIEKSRDVRQVSHCEWSLARRARATSQRLREQARQLRKESQALLTNSLDQQKHQCGVAAVPQPAGRTARPQAEQLAQEEAFSGKTPIRAYTFSKPCEPCAL